MSASRKRSEGKLEDFIRQEYSHEELKAIWDKLLTAQKVEQIEVKCKNRRCGMAFKTDVEVEDRKTIADMAKWLGERGYGKAAPVKQEAAAEIDTAKAAADYTPEERRALIAHLRAKLEGGNE